MRADARALGGDDDARDVARDVDDADATRATADADADADDAREDATPESDDAFEAMMAMDDAYGSGVMSEEKSGRPRESAAEKAKRVAAELAKRGILVGDRVRVDVRVGAPLPARSKKFASDAGAASDAGDWSSPGLASSGPAAKYVKTPSGLVYEDVNEGIGEPARAGDVAVFEYVMRRANGYFIYGTVDCGIGCGNGDPFEAKLGPDGNLIAGLDELLTGMKPGAKRKALIKADLGYKDDPKLSRFAPRPPEFGQQRQIIRLSANDEPMVFEVKLVKTRANSR